MRNSLRYEKREKREKRGLFSRSKSSTARIHYRIVSGAFLLLVGIIWLTLVRHAPPVPRLVDKKNSAKGEETWNKEGGTARLGTHEFSLEERKLGEHPEIRVGERLVGVAGGRKDADTLENSSPNITRDDLQDTGEENLTSTRGTVDRKGAGTLVNSSADITEDLLQTGEENLSSKWEAVDRKHTHTRHDSSPNIPEDESSPNIPEDDLLEAGEENLSSKWEAVDRKHTHTRHDSSPNIPEDDLLEVGEENLLGVDIKDTHTRQNSSPNIPKDDLQEKGEENLSSGRETVDEDDGLDVCDRKIYPAEADLKSDQITILVNGFSESRLELLQRHVQKYSAQRFVHSVYILWGNTSSPDNFLEEWTFTSYGAPIFIVRQVSTSLNYRFLPRSFIKTKAVVICDDDIEIEGTTLGFGLDVWREDEDRIVGFFPRSHAYDFESKSWMYVRHLKSYSIILTKMMILATEYLYRYTCEMPSGVKEYVDAGLNCEDIAMNFLASNRTGRGPMLVEGKARDWGDPRNTKTEKNSFRLSALSGRKDHRKDRGDCITTFEKLWNGMKLQLSYSRASPDLENQMECDKFGVLINCDWSGGSKRDVRRMVGENVISFTHRYAYVTFVTSDRYLNVSLLLAQSLRSSGTIHDLVVLLDPSCSPLNDFHVLHDHYDKVVKVNLPARRGLSAQHGMLSAWLLLDYAKVVFLEIDSLVLANLDHLFQLPEPAAAPQVFMSGKFSTGLLVLKPSNNTYTRLMESLEKIRVPSRSSKRQLQYLLNSFFDGWFQMPAENRLPARYNVPLVFSKKVRLPSWFELDRLYESLGPLMVVRYGSNAVLISKVPRSNSISNNTWWTARFKLFDALVNNDLLPLGNEDIVIDSVPTRMSSSQQTRESLWPPPLLQISPIISSNALTSERSTVAREAFVTVLYAGQNSHFSVAGWAASFHHHHSFKSRAKNLLIVVSTIEPHQYEEHRAYFDEVRVVEPFSGNGELTHESFTVLHLWDQTDFDKLVYVAPTSLFVANCNSLLDYSPFAAVPSVFPPDTFSSKVMSIQPDKHTYNLFKEKLTSYEFCNQPVDRFLNAYYHDWYQRSSMHRMSPSYHVIMDLEIRQQNSPRPWKVLNFEVDWLPDEEVDVNRMWKKTLCDLKREKKPNDLISVCEVV